MWSVVSLNSKVNYSEIEHIQYYSIAQWCVKTESFLVIA